MKKIAQLINNYIAADSFPDTIRPDFLRRAVRDYPCRGGKRLRPALVLWCCGLLGARPEKALPAAAAVEIYHNWTLVHDDIIDDDDVRRNQPTTHKSLETFYSANRNTKGDGVKFGRDFAILTGDLQQAWAADMLLGLAETGVRAEVVIALSRRLHELVGRELISGEALDVDFPYRDAVETADVTEMMYLKTGALLRFCAEAGTAIALDTVNFDDGRIVDLGRFAASAGVAFQYRDDWLGLFGDFEKFGKDICSDFAERKPTALYLAAKAGLSGQEREELETLTGLPEYPRETVERLRELVKKSGAEEMVLAQSQHLSGNAARLLKKFPDNRYRKLLLELNDFLVGRNK